MSQNIHRYIRFELNQQVKYGILKNFHFSTDHPHQLIVLKNSPFETQFEKPQLTNEIIPLEDVKLLAPIAPRKIIGIGLNYRDHALERKKPIPEVPYVFLKAPSAVQAHREPIFFNQHCQQVQHEAELVVIIGQPCKNVSEEAALKYVAGYTIGNDVSERIIQQAEPSFARAKSFDSFAPMGPFLSQGIDWQNKSIKCWVNGELKQNGNTSDMIFSVPKIISFVSEFMTLFPGDAIFTGTPAGVSDLKPGDIVKIAIEDLGVLENPVKLA